MKTIRQQKTSTLLLGLICTMCALVTLQTGCAEEPEKIEEVAEEVKSLSVTVTPEFRIEGLHDLGEGISLQQVYMGVGEIRLEPLGEQADELVYVTRTAVFLNFDVSTGETTLLGSPITLPHGGEFMISIRIEPVDIDELSGDALGDNSMCINGLMARYLGSDLDDFYATGEPTPLPMQDNAGQIEDQWDVPVKWVPWTYSTSKVGVVLLNNVHFEDDSKQRLLINFDLSNWLRGAIDPITTAIETVDVDDHGLDDDHGHGAAPPEAVDVSKDVEASLGNSFESLTNDFDAEALK